jgi:hypothetical protein
MKNYSAALLMFTLVVFLSPCISFGDEPDAWADGTSPAKLDTAIPFKTYTLSLDSSADATDPAETNLSHAPEFSFSLGYAKLNLMGSSGPVTDEDMFRIDGRFTVRPLPRIRGLRVGLGLGMAFGGSGIDSGAIIIDDGHIIVIGSGRDQAVTLFEPEVTASFRLGGPRFFIEPGVAVGGAFGYFRISDHYYYWYDTIYDKWTETGYGKAFIRAAFGSSQGHFGLDFSYARGGDLSFSDNIHGDMEEIYLGVFGGLSF